MTAREGLRFRQSVFKEDSCGNREDHRRSIGVGAVLSLLLFLVPVVASAQSIGGRVTDTTGGILPGVTVEVRSPALIEQVRTAISDGAGQYLIIQLVPGTYSVTFTLPGFSTFVRDGVELIGEATANINAEMQVGNVEENDHRHGGFPCGGRPEHAAAGRHDPRCDG